MEVRTIKASCKKSVNYNSIEISMEATLKDGENPLISSRALYLNCEALCDEVLLKQDEQPEIKSKALFKPIDKTSEVEATKIDNKDKLAKFSF